MSYSSEADKSRLFSVITDPQKRAFAETLDHTVIAAIAERGTLSEEKSTLIREHPEADEVLKLRVLYYNNLIDWATTGADALQEQIMAFIDAPSFVEYPDCFLDENTLAAVKQEHIANHARKISDYRSTFSTQANIDILGTRINDTGMVEVLMLHNPTKRYGTEVAALDSARYDIPPEMKVGLMKINPAIPMYGRGNEVYITMVSPYEGRYGETEHVEVIIGHVGEDGIIVPIENV